MKKIFFGLLLLSLYNPLEAILPPFYESIKEYKALLEDDRLEKVLGSAEFIKEIHRDEKGFRIITTHYFLAVDVTYQPTELIGPAQFKLVFQTPEKLTSRDNK